MMAEAQDSGTYAISAEDAYTVFVIGASGDLAKKKTYPSLYELFLAELLPSRITIVGYARSSIADVKFRSTLREYLKAGTEEQQEKFLSLCVYRNGGYDDAAAFAKVSTEATALETGLSKSGKCNRLFYLAIPPSVFVSSSATVKASGMTSRGWNRVVVEKPFGRDSASSAQLGRDLAQYFEEAQVYRIDHYLGKEMVQNLMVLRFANAVFEPLWSREHISNVQVTFKEPFGTEGRGGYFDDFGIIRDVMQNHLLQVLSLVAMETPVSMRAEDVRDEKVKVLRCIAPVQLQDCVLGQYGPNAAGTKPGYLDDTTVPRGSVTPTFATAVLHINNSRWRGVPFILKCGKALNERKAEIRVQFKEPPSGLFGAAQGRQGVGQPSPLGDGLTHNNELVIRIQPNEAVYLKVMCKMPGLEYVPVETELNLSYKSRYPSRPPPEAYARLLLDVFRGDQSQFVRGDELAAAWAIFSPLLHKIEGEKIAPAVYPYGSRGPPASDTLIRASGYVWQGKYAGEWSRVHEPETGNSSMAAVRSEFGLRTDRLKQVLNHFLAEMSAGLAGEASASIKMIPAYVTALANGTETGSAWAMDMGGTNVRVVQVELQGGGALRMVSEHKLTIPPPKMTCPGPELFDFLAGVCREAGMPDGAVLGFTFSFPTQQTGLDSGYLIEWTKGFSNPGCVNEDPVKLLQAALRRVGYAAVRVTALVNDTVGTLMAGAYSLGPKARVGVILGTGTNACYTERAARIPKWHGAQEGMHVINMEWGGFGSGSAFPMLPLHHVDDVLDQMTPNVGKQRYEKMISGMYLGELSRLLLVQLATAGALFVADGSASPKANSPLYTLWSLQTAHTSTVVADSSPNLDAVAAVCADAMGVSRTTIEDRTIVQEVCKLVARRAARLAAVGVAALCTQMGTGHAGEDSWGHGCTVAIDGSVFKKFPGYRGWMEEALLELGQTCVLDYADDGSGTGAALIALVGAR